MSAFIEATGWTLVHFLWQGVWVGLALLGVLRLLKSAQARYLASAGAMVGLLVLATGTFIWVGDFSGPVAVPEVAQAGSADAGGEVFVLPEKSAERVESGIVAGAETPVVKGGEVLPPEVAGGAGGALFENWEIWVVGVWLLGVGVFGLRFFLDWRAMHSLRRSAISMGSGSKWGERFLVLLGRAGISRPVRILQSASVGVPVVFGMLRPVVIVPAAMLSGLSPGQVDAILLHELAHVRRHDFLVNILQSLLEMVFFFHPAVWWISKQMRVERELCCDDAATAACGDVGEYAGALAALEVARDRGSAGLGMAADGGENGSLLGRIRRLVRGDETAGCARMGWPMAAVSGLALVAALFALAGLSSLVAAANGGKEIGIEKMTTSHFGEPGREIFCIHTEDAILAVVVITPPKGWEGMGMEGGVRPSEEGKDGRMAWAKYHWDDTELEIAFDSREPGKIRLNDQELMLRFGKVIFWRDSEKWADQSTVLAADLPEVVTKDDDLNRLLGEVRTRIIEEFAPKDEKVIVPTKAGRWELGDGVSFELKEELVHAADVLTTGIIRWPKSEKWPALRYEFNVGADAFAVKDRWALGMAKEGRVLWLGKEENFLRIDFSDPEAIERKWLNSAFGDMPDGVQAEFQKQFVLGKKLDRMGLHYIGGNRGGHETVTASTEEEFVVEGEVFDGEGERPFAGVHVQAFSEWSTMEPLAVARSDDRGKFQLRFRASLEMLQAYRGIKLAPLLAGYFDRGLNADGEFYMALEAGEKVEGFEGRWPELVLGDPGMAQFKMAPAARITGLLLNGAGERIPNTYVGMEVDEKDERRAGYITDSTTTDAKGRFTLTKVPKGYKMRLTAWRKPGGGGMSVPVPFGEKMWERLVVRFEDGKVDVAVPGVDDPGPRTLVRVVRKQVEVEGPELPLNFARTLVGWVHTAEENLTTKVVDDQTWNRAVAWSSLVHVFYGVDAKEHEPMVVPLIGESPISEVLFHLGKTSRRRLFVKTVDGAVHVLGRLDPTTEVAILTGVGEVDAARELEERLEEEWEAEKARRKREEEEAKAAEEEAKEIVVEVRADGKIEIGGVELSGEELLARLQAVVVAGGEDRAVMVRGEEKTRYDAIIKVLDVCREAGIWNISIATRPKGEAPKIEDENEKKEEGGYAAVTVNGKVVDSETGEVIRQAVVVKGGTGG